MAGRRPAAGAAVRLLEVDHPLGEEAARVGEDALLDVLENGGRRAAGRKNREAAQADVLDRAVGVLHLRVAREDAVAELGALVPAEREDACRHRELVGGHRLAADGDLGAQLPCVRLARARDLDAGRHEREHVGDVHCGG
eukprot:7376809-Prymnesium_polylepis.1